MKKIMPIVVTVSLLACIFCSLPRGHWSEDDFYNDTGEFPAMRIPLLKPYYLFDSDSPGDSWHINIHPAIWFDESPGVKYIYSNIRDVQKFAIEGEVIMIYSPYVDEDAGEGIQENYLHWFVMNPREDNAVGFHTQVQFLVYIQQKGITIPDWLSPDAVMREFVRSGCLDWIPDCP